MVSIFDGCDDSCGWVAAILSALAYGSFGVPIKETRNIDLHPLVFQSYKTCTMFSCSWLVLWMGVAPAWTRWGLLSGLLWVAGGTGGIYAIRMAGLAIAVGTWASVMICVNFVWGILIFREPVASLWATAGAFLLLALGLIGMSHFSAPQTQARNTSLNDDGNSTNSDEEIRSPMVTNPNYGSDRENTIENEDQDRKNIGYGEENDTSFSLMVDEDSSDSSDTVILCGITMTKRVAGFCGAIFNGLMTGSSLIPLHYAKEEGFGGADYMISFASGALIANGLLWGLFFSFNYVKQLQCEVPGSRLIHAYESMPIWHFRQLWLPGLIAGKFRQRCFANANLHCFIPFSHK